MREKLRDPDYVYGKRWLILLVLCISLIVIILDNTILNVALPTLAKGTEEGGLGSSQSQLQWVVDSYTIVFAGLLLTAGSMGDKFGRYRALTFGLVVFGLASALSAFATSATMLIFTRALMGIGGAFIMPSTLSILTNVFRDNDERRKAIGIWAGVSALGLGVGPVTGGTLLAHFWWGSVFLINVPVVIIGLVAGYALIPESRDRAAPRLDPGGAVLSIVGLGVLLWAVIEAPGKGWASAPVLAAFGIGGLVLAGFFVWELRSSHPMLDMKFFKNPRFSAASAAITITFLALFGVIFVLTLYLQTVLGYSTIKAGAILLPQSLVMMVLAPLSSVWVKRWGNRVVVAAGMALVSASMFLFTTFTTTSSVWHVIALTIALGAGMANVMAPATDSIMGSLPPAKAGVGSAVNDTTRQVGGAVGVAVLGSVLASRFSSHMDNLLGGQVPDGLLAGVRDSIGSAFNVIDNSPQARPFASTIGSAARDSYMAGLHTASIVAGFILLVGVGIVVKWLPARHRDDAVAGSEAPATVDTGALAPVDGAAVLAAADGNGNGTGSRPVVDAAPDGVDPAPAGIESLDPNG